jgi:hypothetical protein
VTATSLREKLGAFDISGGVGPVEYIVEMPVEGGGTLRLQGPEESIPSGLVPAANPLGTETLIAKTDETVQAALDDLAPAINATTERMRKFAADEVTVEFGLLLGVEGGVVIAKGSAGPAPKV